MQQQRWLELRVRLDEQQTLSIKLSVRLNKQQKLSVKLTVRLNKQQKLRENIQMAKALVARDNKLITAIVMDGARVKMVRAGNNQMVTAVRAKARAACLQILCGVGSRLAMVAMGLVTVAMDSRLTMVATGIWMRAMAGARVKMVRAGNN